MNRKRVKMARCKTHPYAERPTPGGGVTSDRLDNPPRIERYPYLCIDYDSRELCINSTVRIPLEQVEWYVLLEPSEADLEWETMTKPPPPPVEVAKPRGRKRANAA